MEFLQQKTETVAAKRAVNSNKVTFQMNDAIVQNSKILDVETQFNASMATFEKTPDATATASQNLTTFGEFGEETG